MWPCPSMSMCEKMPPKKKAKIVAGQKRLVLKKDSVIQPVYIALLTVHVNEVMWNRGNALGKFVGRYAFHGC